MKIDTHQHYWRYEPADYSWISDAMVCLKRDRYPEHCGPEMAAGGVSYSIAVQARSEEKETDFLLVLARQSPAIAAVVGWTDLRSRHLEARLLAWADQQSLKGFRHILQDEPNFEQLLDDTNFGHGLVEIQRRGYVYDVLVRGVAQLEGVREFCATHDKHWLVLDHLGKPDLRAKADGASAEWRAALRDLAVLPHVVCKISGLATETDFTDRRRLDSGDIGNMIECMDEALDAFGPERLLFGSDWPVCELAAPYQTVCGIAQAWASSRLSESQQQAFWSGNAIKCYGLSEHSLSGGCAQGK